MSGHKWWHINVYEYPKLEIRIKPTWSGVFRWKFHIFRLFQLLAFPKQGITQERIMNHIMCTLLKKKRNQHFGTLSKIYIAWTCHFFSCGLYASNFFQFCSKYLCQINNKKKIKKSITCFCFHSMNFLSSHTDVRVFNKLPNLEKM